MSTEVAGASASYAAEVVRLLWPDPWDAPDVTRRPEPEHTPHRHAYIFPSRRRPRLLVPTDVPACAVMVRRLGSARSSWGAPARILLERSVGTRAFRLLGWPVLTVRGADAGADSIERHLGRHLGDEVRVGVLLGTRRVNEKPVLQVFGSDGTVLGYAKVGHNPLTAELVRREAASLSTLAEHRPRSFAVPRVLHHGRWAGLEVLVVSALPTDRGSKVGHDTLVRASRELTGLSVSAPAPLGGTAWFADLSAGAARLGGGEAAVRLRSALEVLRARHGGDTLVLGGWHGDWGLWNMGTARGVLQVWDWERYAPQVPAGFDLLHLAAQAVRPGDRARAGQERTFLGSAPALLRDAGVGEDRHRATLALYLATITLRYLEALQHGTTPALECRTAWSLRLLERQLDLPDLGTRGRP